MERGTSPNFDIIIVGAGIAGASLAHALSTLPRPRPLKIALLERSFTQPDRIVGEVLQPGGVDALHELGMESSIEGIDAMVVKGYNIVQGGESLQAPYPKGKAGRAFHHGRFVMGLRKIALGNANVVPIEATATKLVECPDTQRVVGIEIKSSDDQALPKGVIHAEDGKFIVYSDLVVIADGGSSNFRQPVLNAAVCKPKVYSYTFATVLTGVTLPVPGHATVILPKGLGPVFMYQLSETETRIGVDLQEPLPVDVQRHVLENVVPELPASLQSAVIEAYSKERIRKMRNSFLPAVQQGANASSKKGVMLLGDAWNMRHSLTGGGMTVALKDVVYLRRAFEGVKDVGDWEGVGRVVKRWHWERKQHSSTLNVVSAVFYEMWKRDGGVYTSLRKGCAHYCHNATPDELMDCVSLISGLRTSPAFLVKRVTSITLYVGWLLFTQSYRTLEATSVPKGNGTNTGTGTKRLTSPSRPKLREYPALLMEAILMGWTMLIIVLPILWSEVRWWSPGRA